MLWRAGRWAAAASLSIATSACIGMLALDDVYYLDRDGGSSDGAADVTTDAADGAIARESGALDGATWCAANAPDALFCADFDDQPAGPVAIPKGWSSASNTYLEDAGLYRIDSLARSAPNGLLVRVPGSLPDCAYHRVDKSIDTASFTSATLRLQVHAGNADGGAFQTPGDGAQVAQLRVRFASGLDTTLEIFVTTTGVEIRDEPSPDAGQQTRHPAQGVPSGTVGRWVPIEVTLDLSTGKIRSNVDGDRQESSLGTPVPTSASHVEARVGISCAGNGSGPIDVSFDDVVLTAP